jgi:hypothetical protein
MHKMADPLVILKTGLDNTAGLLNKGTRHLLELFNPQNMNVFEVILTPTYPASSWKEGIDIAGGNYLAKLHLKSIGTTFTSIEYDNLNEVKGTKGVVYPEEITLTFIENQEGAVRNFLNSWFKQIIFTNELSIGGNAQWVFKDNQLASEKNAIIIPLQRTGTPSGAWIQINGLKLKNVGALEFSQESAEMMVITATCKVDNIWFKTP